MATRRTAAKRAATGPGIEEIIRKAQQQPGITELVELMKQSAEAETLLREQRDAVIVTNVVSATETAA